MKRLKESYADLKYDWRTLEVSVGYSPASVYIVAMVCAETSQGIEKCLGEVPYRFWALHDIRKAHFRLKFQHGKSTAIELHVQSFDLSVGFDKVRVDIDLGRDSKLIVIPAQSLKNGTNKALVDLLMWDTKSVQTQVLVNLDLGDRRTSAAQFSMVQ